MLNTTVTKIEAINLKRIRVAIACMKLRVTCKDELRSFLTRDLGC